MKIKLDFVTNSSSTSFCVWGIKKDYMDLPEKLLEKVYKYYLKTEKSKELISFKIFQKKLLEFDYKYISILIEYLETLNLESILSEDILIIGRSPFSMKDDETPYLFKSNLILNLKDLGFKDFVINSICEEVIS